MAFLEFFYSSQMFVLRRSLYSSYMKSLHTKTYFLLTVAVYATPDVIITYAFIEFYPDNLLNSQERFSVVYMIDIITNT